MNEDTVEFTSNRSDTAIKFRGSPLAELNGRQILALPARGTFYGCEDGKKGTNPLRLWSPCRESIQTWAETGDNIPPC